MVIIMCNSYLLCAQHDNSSQNSDETTKMIERFEIDFTSDEINYIDRAEEVSTPSTILVVEEPSWFVEYSQRLAIKVFFFADDIYCYLKSKSIKLLLLLRHLRGHLKK